MKFHGIRITGPGGAPYALGQPMLMFAGCAPLGRVEAVHLLNGGTQVHFESFTPTAVVQDEVRNLGAWLFYEACAHVACFHPQVQLISFASSRPMPGLGDPVVQAAARVAAVERIGVTDIQLTPMQSGAIVVSGTWAYNKRNLRELLAALEEQRAIYQAAPIAASPAPAHWLRRLARLPFRVAGAILRR